VTGSTICALASGSGAGARAVIRISGPEASRLVHETCSVGGRPLVPAERGATRARFADGGGEQPVLLLWMPGPGSYTREDVAELHLLGSPPLVRVALDRLLALGATPAAPGEFTRRAFLNGRIDLTRAEGVAELVAAGSAAERRAATALLVGGLDERLSRLRGELEELRALAEASLDFDETDTGHVPTAELDRRTTGVDLLLEEALGWEQRRVPAGGAARVVLVGAPNAGKSALFNRLTSPSGASGGQALVSELAGTTRDAKVALWELPGGVTCELVDTAGEEERPRAGVEGAAQERTEQERRSAALLLCVLDATAESLEPAPPSGDPPLVTVWNKLDLARAGPCPAGALPVSALSGEGLQELARRVAHSLEGRRGEAASLELTARHRAALSDARDEIARARAELIGGGPLDLFAEGLRAATDALDQIAGRTTSEEVLDRIFAHFCLGK